MEDIFIVPFVSVVPSTKDFASALCGRIKQQTNNIEERKKLVDYQKRELQKRLNKSSTFKINKETQTESTLPTPSTVFPVDRPLMNHETGSLRSLKDIFDSVQVGQRNDHSSNTEPPNTFDGVHREEIFWEIRFQESHVTYDSDIFKFQGMNWRLLFARNSKNNYSFMLSLAQRGEVRINAEFRLHCDLKSLYRRKCKGFLHFSPLLTSQRGFKNFIGPELVTFIDNEGMLKLSVIMSTPPLLLPMKELHIQIDKAAAAQLKPSADDVDDSGTTATRCSDDDGWEEESGEGGHADFFAEATKGTDTRPINNQAPFTSTASLLPTPIPLQHRSKMSTAAGYPSHNHAHGMRLGIGGRPASGAAKIGMGHEYGTAGRVNTDPGLR